jgi:hypothetical protein
MKKIYVVLNDANVVEGYYNELKDAKSNCFGEFTILEVTDIIETDYVLKYTKTKLSDKV